jgi:hypothetical protein
VELEVAVLLILPAQQKEAAKVSTLRFPIWVGLLTYPILDPIILSDNESVGAESETDYSDLDVDFRAKGDSNSPPVADSELADGDGFGLGTTHTLDRLVANYLNNGNDKNNGVVDDTQFRLSADRLGSASPSHRSVTHQASKLRVHTDITQGSASYVELDVIKEVEDEGIDVFAKGDDDDDADTRSTKRSRSSAISCNNPPSDSNVSDSELQDGKRDSAQSPQPGPSVACLQQSDLTNDPLLKHRRRRDATRNVRRKRPRTPASTGLASAASTDSAALESNDLEDHQSIALLTAPSQEREIRDIDQEMVVDRGTNDSNDEDYSDMSNAAGSEIASRPRSRKRVKRAKDMGDDDVAACPNHPLEVLCQAIAPTSSNDMQESEEIPIHGYFTLKTIASKVAYCLTFS